jgi:hypothetical protein
MRHHETKGCLVQETSGHASEYPFTEPTVAISPRHDQIGALLLGQTNKVVRVGFSHVDAKIALTFGAVALKIFRDIADPLTCPILFT